MKLVLKRQQTTKIGTLFAGMNYEFDEDSPDQMEVAKSLVERGFATPVDAAADAQAASEKEAVEKAAAEEEAAEKAAAEKEAAEKAAAEKAAAEKGTGK